MTKTLTQAQKAALLRAARAAKMAGDKYKALADEIKNVMKSEEIETIEAGGIIASIKEVSTSTIDWKKFQADHPELREEIEKYKTSNSTVRLYLK